jgi:hypothetical protein
MSEAKDRFGTALDLNDRVLYAGFQRGICVGTITEIDNYPKEWYGDDRLRYFVIIKDEENGQRVVWEAGKVVFLS